MSTTNAGPMDGLVVADFSRVLAAPYATMLLADLGADVIKIERPGTGDDTRAWGPPFAGEDATYFLSVNRNKRSMAVDLADPGSRGEIVELIRHADVLIENFKPGTMERLGLSFEHVAEINPRLIYCSVTGFGSGKGAELPGYDLLAQAVGGLMSVTGTDPEHPVKAGVAVVDILTGLHAAVGMLSALRAREATGRGQRVEVNLLSTLLSSMVNQATGYTAAGSIPGAMGNRHPSIAPYSVFDTADRPFVLAVGNDRQFRSLCAGLGVPYLAGDARFATNTDRVSNVETLTRLISDQLSARPAAQWFDLLTPLGVPCGPVNDVKSAFDLAEQLGLDPTISIGEGDDAVALVANPISLSHSPPRYHSRPPQLGEHTEQLRRWLSSTDTDRPNTITESPSGDAQ